MNEQSSGKKNIAKSIREKLLNHARKNNRPFNEVLLYYGIERFLYRLSLSSYKDVFFLKGALMFFVWQIPAPRPTRDIDLLGRTSNSPKNLMRICQEICATACEDDGVNWSLETIRLFPTQNQREYQGYRVTFEGNLDTAIIHMQIDVGFSDIIYPRPVLLEYPSILNLPKPQLLSYTPESMIAEKTHAMLVLGELNSRIKDYFDVWFLSRQFEFEGQKLLDAIAKTFFNREMEIALIDSAIIFFPDFKNDAAKNVQWQSFITRNELTAIAPPTFDKALDEIIAFIFPVLNALKNSETFTKYWRGGMWELIL